MRHQDCQPNAEGGHGADVLGAHIGLTDVCSHMYGVIGRPPVNRRGSAAMQLLQEPHH